MSNKPVPVTIITGFLGAGKTTLLNDILHSNPDMEFLIIENEAGEVNIDGELINKEKRNKVYELSNGCICCSLNTELGTLLNSIILSKMRYDYVLIEATGIADPGQVIDMFSGPRVQRYFTLDGVIGLIDASTFLKRFNDFNEIRKQVAQSDIILLNKIDLVTDDTLTEIELQLSYINPLAQVQRTINSNTDGIKILHCELFQPASVEKSIGNFSNLTLITPIREHAHKIQTLSFSILGNFDLKKLSWWLENFLFANAKNVLRIKGILSIEDMQRKIALQSVGDNFHISEGSLWHKNEQRVNRIVFIGTNLNKDELQKNLLSLLATTNKVTL